MTLDSAQVRYGKELDRPFVTVSVVTAEGTPLEARVPTGPPPLPPLSQSHSYAYAHTLHATGIPPSLDTAAHASEDIRFDFTVKRYIASRH